MHMKIIGTKNEIRKLLAPLILPTAEDHDGYLLENKLEIISKYEGIPIEIELIDNDVEKDTQNGN